MKKIYLLLLSLSLGSATCFAQTTTIELTSVEGPTVVVTNNQIFSHVVAPLATHQHDFRLKNTSANTEIFLVRKFENLINQVTASDKAEASFCNGTTCYGANIMSATVSIAAGVSIDFKADLIEASIVGESNVSYEISNMANGSDVLNVELRYNVPASLRSFSPLFTNASNVYPNPSSSRSFIDLNVVKELNGTSLKIYNSLGALVSSKNVSLNKGKNTLSLDNEGLESGIYIICISNGSSIITRKLTVSK